MLSVDPPDWSYAVQSFVSTSSISRDYVKAQTVGFDPPPQAQQAVYVKVFASSSASHKQSVQVPES